MITKHHVLVLRADAIVRQGFDAIVWSCAAFCHAAVRGSSFCTSLPTYLSAAVMVQAWPQTSCRKQKCMHMLRCVMHLTSLRQD